MNTLLKTIAISTALFSSQLFAGTLSYKTYNPQQQAIFPVSSTLIVGDKDAVLVDAQFSTKDAEQLVQLIKDSGKNLKYIVISAGDPDFYFGLEPIVKAFPNTPILASEQVVAHIEKTKDAKLAYWGPILKDAAPQQLYVPTISKTKNFELEGHKIQLKAPQSYAAYLWVPSTRTVLGGVGISSGIHVWTADAQTAKQRQDWQRTLQQIQSLGATTVIPGHYIGDMPKQTEAVQFTAQYLKDFEKALKQHKASGEVIAEMKTQYPTLAEESSLELSSKVNTGEMPW
ncbi:Vmh family MBL fold metallo-hydrolase [Acinetobacter larvae]|uniref:MBL fold metallo-hydrolase n=1 Tax=Acinetobacter larvae TaxID=1789224 RepID=A0A1B2M0Q4_9GAMM|nr:Vmh family MBL fold metallo-hydrolase [Acinetobacter larvae]AOA58782.1 MBL fold metallo-hydrolase [Acinetobacter larvae]